MCSARQIVGTIKPRARRAGFQPFARIGDRRQLIVVDFDQRRGILGDAAIVGDDERNRLADIEGFVVDKEARLGIELHCGGRERERNPVAGQKRPQVGIEQDGMHALDRLRCRRVDAFDARMRRAASRKYRMQHVGQDDVVDIARFSTQQPRVFDAGDRAPDQLAQKFARHVAFR